MTTIHSAVKWLKKELGVGVVRVRARMLSLLCSIYLLWKVRNEIVFDSAVFNHNSVVKRIKTMVYKVLYTLVILLVLSSRTDPLCGVKLYCLIHLSPLWVWGNLVCPVWGVLVVCFCEFV
ncbi:hypothetical protein ACS0TY_011871 [Phlomoides rotata]